MRDVWVLTEGVEVEGMTIVGVFSSLNKASARARDLLRSYSPPSDFEIWIDKVRIDSDSPISINAPYRLRKPWKDWV